MEWANVSDAMSVDVSEVLSRSELQAKLTELSQECDEPFDDPIERMMRQEDNLKAQKVFQGQLDQIEQTSRDLQQQAGTLRQKAASVRAFGNEARDTSQWSAEELLEQAARLDEAAQSILQ